MSVSQENTSDKCDIHSIYTTRQRCITILDHAIVNTVAYTRSYDGTCACLSMGLIPVFLFLFLLAVFSMAWCVSITLLMPKKHQT